MKGAALNLLKTALGLIFVCDKPKYIKMRFIRMYDNVNFATLHNNVDSSFALLQNTKRKKHCRSVSTFLWYSLVICNIRSRGHFERRPAA